MLDISKLTFHENIPKPELVLTGIEKKPTNYNPFKKYEVIYSFKGQGDTYGNRRYIARVVTNNIDSYVSEGNTQFVVVRGFHEVSKRRSDYLTDKGLSFEFVRYKA